ncbi:type IV secretory system conjugative DNA transfer family protein [Salmonella enterica]|nr:type IV secretory system conjugative DNA transfer family protein [Salmonella enterica]EMC8988202.1 type IV secretory system conjugative DNA transfer family protein [Salmonella enterica]
MDMIKRLRRTLGGLLMAGAVSIVAVPNIAAARVIPECIPTPEGAAANPEESMVWMRKVCDAENGVYSTWEAKLQALDEARQDMAAATSTGDWEMYRRRWSEALPLLKELQAAADTNRSVLGGNELASLYRADLALFLQNAGLGPAASLDDFGAKIDAGLDGPRASAAASAGVNVLQQSVSRGLEFVRGLGKQAGLAVLATRKAESDALAAQAREEMRGTSVKGYFGGFGRRISEVWGGFLFMLLVVTFGGAWIAKKRGQEPVIVATAAGIAYLLPGLGMMLVFIFMPFLPQWFLIAATLAGTAAMYRYGGRVFDAIGNRFGRSAVGEKLRFVGRVLDNLRTASAPGTSTPQSVGAAAVKPAAKAQATHGSARWGTTEEITSKGHLGRPGQAAGLALARVPDAPASLDQRFRYVGHVVTVAPNGSGKGIGQVIPNLLEYPGSCLVLDVKGENAAVTARARRELGHNVYVVDPFGVNGPETASFNVLDRLDVTNPDCVSESATLADSLVIADGKGDAVHFDESAKILLQGLMLHVAGLDDPTRRNLGEVRRLITGGEDALFELLAEMAADDGAAFGIPARAANTLMGMADKERGSVLSTARRNTAFLDDPRIAAALSRSDFDLSAIKSELMTVYLVMPANRIGPNARFLRLFVGSVIAAITSSAKQPPHRVAFVLDEFAQLGYMKAIEDAVSLMRGYGLAFWVFLQDLSQLKGVYPRWQTFMANSAKVFFGTDDYDTAKYVSDSLGKSTIEYETHNEGRNSGSGVSGGGGSLNRGKSSGSSQQISGRELLTPDEVMRLGPERPLVLVKGEYPYLLARLNYLADREYAGLADPNPYHG